MVGGLQKLSLVVTKTFVCFQRREEQALTRQAIPPLQRQEERGLPRQAVRADFEKIAI